MPEHDIQPQRWGGALRGGSIFRHPIVLAGILGSVTFLLFKMMMAAILGDRSSPHCA